MTYLCDECIHQDCIGGCEYPLSTVDPLDCPYYEGPEMDDDEVWE